MIRTSALLTVLASAAAADPVAILDIDAQPQGAAWRFDVTLEHPDTGWDHFADAWRVELPDGTVLGERILFHPHETEQPFTRARVIEVPGTAPMVLVRARCSVDGWNAEATAFRMSGR